MFSKVDLLCIHVYPRSDELCAHVEVISCLLYRVLDAVDVADHLLLFLRFPPPPDQAEDAAGAETEGDQSDRLQRGLHLPVLYVGPQYVCYTLWLLVLQTRYLTSSHAWVLGTLKMFSHGGVQAQI